MIDKEFHTFFRNRINRGPSSTMSDRMESLTHTEPPEPIPKEPPDPSYTRPDSPPPLHTQKLRAEYTIKTEPTSGVVQQL